MNVEHFSKKLVKGEDIFAGRWGSERKEEVGVSLKSNWVEREDGERND